MRTVILSPHFDDAAVSCCDHVFRWLRGGHPTTVLTIFTSFRTGIVAEHMRGMMAKMGIGTIDELERRRADEDVRAMLSMAAEWRHLGYVDGVFRVHDGDLLYGDFRALCSGKVSVQDDPLIDAIAARLREFRKWQRVVVPLGVGQHVDHVIVRSAAERCFEPCQLHYYVDFPYARNPLRWRPRHLLAVARSRRSFAWTSEGKREVLRCYETQMPFLFRRKPYYAEIILFPDARATRE